MSLPSVYSYDSPKRFLLDAFAEMQKADSQLSVRKWAKRMGLSTHTQLVMLMQGKRPLRQRHVEFLSKGIGLGSQERLYFQALVQFDSAKTVEEKEVYRVWLAELNPGKDFKTRELDEFKVIADWVHCAILAMTHLKDFEGTPEAIHGRLGGEATISQVRSALERLMELKLLALGEDGKLRPTANRITSKNDQIDLGARKYHKDVAQLAIEAVDEQPVDLREFQSFAMSIPTDKIPLAKEMLRRFRAQLSAALGSDEADQVYQCNLQFFQLTQGPSRMVGKEAKSAGTEAETQKEKEPWVPQTAK